MSPRAVENVTLPLPFDGGVERTTQVVGSDNSLYRDTPTRTHIVATELNLKWRNLFTGPMQTFADTNEFKKALYKYSVAKKFEYAFKRNSSSRMSVYCKVNGCAWKLTANAVGKTDGLILLDNIAYARTEHKFNRAMSNMENAFPEMHEWLLSDGNVERWAVCENKFNRAMNNMENVPLNFHHFLYPAGRPKL